MSCTRIFLFALCLSIAISAIESAGIFGFFDLLFNRKQQDKAEQEHSATHFSYYDSSSHGPSHWPGDCSVGKSQSPIAYDTVKPVSASNSDPLRMAGSFDKKPSEIKFYNNGHGVAVSFVFADGSVPEITGGPLGSSVYKLVQFHSHWPCEHMPIKFQALCKFETHFVHVNAKYSSLAEAVEQPDGLAVVGIMHTGIPLAKPLPYIDMMTKVLSPKSEYIEKTNLFTYSEAMGFTQFPKYISYDGSLTTPSCKESVKWIVVDKLYPIPLGALVAVRRILDSSSSRIWFNNRPVQPINGRTVGVYNEL